MTRSAFIFPRVDLNIMLSWPTVLGPPRNLYEGVSFWPRKMARKRLRWRRLDGASAAAQPRGLFDVLEF